MVALRPPRTSANADVRDRVTHTVRHLFNELSRHPMVYRRLEAEQALLSALSLQRYLNAAVRETIRLHPAMQTFTWYRVLGKEARHRGHIIQPQVSPHPADRI